MQAVVALLHVELNCITAASNDNKVSLLFIIHCAFSSLVVEADVVCFPLEKGHVIRALHFKAKTY